MILFFFKKKGIYSFNQLTLHANIDSLKNYYSNVIQALMAAPILQFNIWTLIWIFLVIHGEIKKSPFRTMSSISIAGASYRRGRCTTLEIITIQLFLSLTKEMPQCRQ